MSLLLFLLNVRVGGRSGVTAGSGTATGFAKAVGSGAALARAASAAAQSSDRAIVRGTKGGARTSPLV